MPDITLTTHQTQPVVLLPDGLADHGHAYRVSMSDAQGHAAYVFFRALAGPIGPSFLQIRLQMRLREERCCLCRLPLCAEDLVTDVCTEVLTQDTAPLFPNCFVHTACVDNCLFHGSDAGNSYRCATRLLMQSWRAAQDYTCWF